MEASDSRIGAAHVLAWSTVLLTFGLIQGALYLKGYWSSFGLDPFQFGDASDLALVGLTSVGVTVALMILAAPAGGYLGSTLVVLSEKHRWIVFFFPILLTALILFLVFFVPFGLLLVIGMLLTWVLTWLTINAPDIPKGVKEFKFLPYVFLALAYIPMGAYFYGQRAAERVKSGDRALQVIAGAQQQGACVTGGLFFAGRLGDVYVLFCRKSGSVFIQSMNSETALQVKK